MRDIDFRRNTEAFYFTPMCAFVSGSPSSKYFALEHFTLSDKVKESWDYEKIKALIPQRKNVLISGGTGTGKTSFLNALMSKIPQNERIVSIEDSQEIFIENHNKTQLAVPKEESEIYGYTQAINNAMRLRPDRLLLGEIDIRNTLAFCALIIQDTKVTSLLFTLIIAKMLSMRLSQMRCLAECKIE